MDSQKRPYPVAQVVCSLCGLLWSDHEDRAWLGEDDYVDPITPATCVRLLKLDRKGPPGPQGPVGPMGPTGARGETGPAGLPSDTSIFKRPYNWTVHHNTETTTPPDNHGPDES